jgi:hypothetical protein
MVGDPLLAENGSIPYPRSPFSCGAVLHLVYEFAQPNPAMKLPCAGVPKER